MDSYIKDNGRINRIFLIMVLLVVGFFASGQLLFPEGFSYQQYSCKKFDTEWNWVKDDGTREPLNLPVQCDVKRGETAVMETVLPRWLEDNTYLCFKSGRQDMKFYIGGELCGSYTTEHTRFFGKTSAVAYVLIKMQPDYAGKVLRVEAKTDSDYTGIFYSVLYGDQLGIWRHLFSLYGAELAIAALMLFLSLLSLVVSVGLRLFYHRAMDLEYLSWGVILAAVWIISNSALRQIFFPNLSVVSDMAFLMIMLAPIPFLLYMNGVQKGRYRLIYLVTECIAIIDTVVCIFLQVKNILDFADSILAMAIVAGVSIGVMALTSVADAIRGEMKSYWLNAMGAIGAFFFVSIQIIMYFHRTVSFNGTLVAVGLIFLLIAAGISTLQDIYNMEKERQQAILASESKAAFLANMSHEIRTPINAVLGMGEMIIRESKEPQILEYGQNIQSAGRSLLALVNDILDFSKIESGKLVLILAEYNVSDLLNDSYHMVSARAKDKGLEIRILNDHRLPALLEGDEIRIRQILINLLTNAIKYTERGHIDVLISGTLQSENQILMQIEVKDTGIGIAKEDREKLFQSFERLEEKRNRSIEGTGLGLTITKQLVDLMQGTITVESEKGVGSTFRVCIPQRVVSWDEMGEFATDTQVLRSQQTCVEDSFEIPDGRILVVDDVEMNLKVMRGLLRHLKLSIDTADGGQACLEKLKENKYDLIFLDHMMPEMDGLETLAHMREMDEFDENTPVIMLTANAISGAKEGYLAAGFHDYLSKPVTILELKKILLKYIPDDMIVRKETEEEK